MMGPRRPKTRRCYALNTSLRELLHHTDSPITDPPFSQLPYADWQTVIQDLKRQEVERPSRSPQPPLAELLDHGTIAYALAWCAELFIDGNDQPLPMLKMAGS